MPPSRPLLRPVFALTALLFCASAVAADEAPQCPEPPARVKRAPSLADREQPTYVRAEAITGVKGDVGEFAGNVELRRGGLHVTADRLHYDAAAERIGAEGNVTLSNAAGDTYRTPSINLMLDDFVGATGPSDFTLADGRARGDAATIRFEGKDHARLERVRYTTCRPGQDDWFLRMRELDLDASTEIGTARHSTVEFFGVPVLYLPYLSFPITDQRKSGFLMPSVGHSSQRGAEIEVPYYFNLAPNHDDTLTPRYLGRRGLQLQNQYRYLSENSRGQLDVEYLPGDDVFGDDRSAGVYRHKHSFGPLWSATVDLRGVSDKDYFLDFGDHLNVTSQTHLPQIAELNYRSRLWNFTTRLADYQTVDRSIVPADRPYARLPQLLLSSKAPVVSGQPLYQLDGEWVRFDRDTGVLGSRLNLYPTVALPLVRSYGFFTPRVGVRHTAYNLTNAADDTPGVTAGVLSLDSGLLFDRETRWGERAFTQTLEPRLFYLYVPHKDQDALPNFDTSVPDFSFFNLFRDNRFIGGDRIGDANQLTAAITSRFIDEQVGIERLSLSLGQIYYFDDRRVNLPAATETANTSDVVAEATAWLVGNWYVRGSVQRNQDAHQTSKGNFYLQYHPQRDRILNLGYRFIREELQETDVSAHWPLGARWTLIGRSLFSVRDDRNVESYAGLEYNTCCWAVRLLARRLFVEDRGQVDSLLFQIELTGLGRFGGLPDSPLQQGLFSFPPGPGAEPYRGP